MQASTHLKQPQRGTAYKRRAVLCRSADAWRRGQGRNTTILNLHSSISVSTATLLTTAGVLFASPAVARPPVDIPPVATAPPSSVAGENVGFITNQEVDAFRKGHSFRRGSDGKIALQNKQTNEWFDAKCDLLIPGFMLLRHPAGQVNYIAYAVLQQVDMSDDIVVGSIATSSWETEMSPVQAIDPGEKKIELELNRDEFYNLGSLSPSLSDVEEQMVAQEGMPSPRP